MEIIKKRRVVVDDKRDYCEFCGKKLEGTKCEIRFAEKRIRDDITVGCAPRDFFDVCEECKLSTCRGYYAKRKAVEDHHKIGL